MQQALRPYLTTGVAVLGAGTIAVAPLAPPLPDVQILDIQLTAGLDFGQLVDLGDVVNPLEVYPALVTNTFNNLLGIGENWFEAPLPILQAVAGNQIGYIGDFFEDPMSILGVPGQMFGNLQNVFAALTSLAIGVDGSGAGVELIGDLLGILQDPSLGGLLGLVTQLVDIVGDLAGGANLLEVGISLPPAVVMGLAGLGPLANGALAFGDSLGAFTGAVNGGEYLTALGALVASPGYIGDALLNGQLGLNLDLGGIAGADIPLLNGLLQPMENATVTLLGDLLKLNVNDLGGLTDGFVNYLPGVIAEALGGGSVNPLDGIFGGLGLGSTLDLGNLLSFLNPGDLLAMLNLDGLAADIGSLLPGALPLDAVGDLVTGILSPVLILGLLGM